LLLIPASLYLTWEIVACFIVVPISNPFARLLFISHSVVDKDGTVSYAKGYNVGDISLAFHAPTYCLQTLGPLVYCLLGHLLLVYPTVLDGLHISSSGEMVWHPESGQDQPVRRARIRGRLLWIHGRVGSRMLSLCLAILQTLTNLAVCDDTATDLVLQLSAAVDG